MSRHTFWFAFRTMIFFPFSHGRSVLSGLVSRGSAFVRTLNGNHKRPMKAEFSDH
jgi:hypothetical protein